MAKNVKGKPSPPAGDTKFFHQLSTLQRSWIHVGNFLKKKEDDRFFTIRFRMPLNGNNVRSAPHAIQTAYAVIEGDGLCDGSIRQIIENVHIEIYATDSSKKAIEELKSATVSDLEVKEISSGKGDKSIVLTFKVVYPMDWGVLKFLSTHFAGDVFLRFDSAQASLLDLADVEKDEEEDDEQGELLPDEAAGEAAED
jgi:hypothetical protein